jgi:hypothetical protein
LQEETTPGAVQVAGLDAGAQHVDAVQLCLGGDGVLVPVVAEPVLADVDGEVLGDLAPVQHLARAQRDRVLAAQTPSMRTEHTGG